MVANDFTYDFFDSEEDIDFGFESQPFQFSNLNRLSNRNWRVCVDEPFKNCEKIYPTQQRKVKEFLSSLEVRVVNRVIVFGSSTTGACRIDSDLDVFVELTGKVTLKLPCFDFELDLWTNFMVDDRLLEEIESTGVVVLGGD